MVRVRCPRSSPRGVDVGAECFGDPQSVDREQGNQRVLVRCTEAGGHQQRADLVTVQADGVGFVVQSESSNVHGG
jgi:hypothetical protein